MSPRSDFDTPLTQARRAHLDALTADLVQYAATMPQPPTSTQVLDLWAHARQRVDDGEQAACWVKHVIDLGWRPMDGVR